MNTQAIDNMLSRRSCRAFKPDMPSHELIETVCRVGSFAPTGHGKQSPTIIAITNRELRDKLSLMNARIWADLRAARAVSNGEQPAPRKPDSELSDPFYGAPVVLLVVADKKSPTANYDGCSVLCQLVNAANAVGLDSCWVHRAKQEVESDEGQAILRSLGFDGDYVGVGHVVLGYRAKELPQPLPRKADFVKWAE